MTAPQRWIHSPEESSDEERSLLKQGLDVGPPPDAEAQTWKALLAQIGPVGPAGPASPPPASPPPASPAPPAPLPPPASVATPVAASGLAGAIKAGVLAVATSALLVTGYTTLRGPTSPERATASVHGTSTRPDLPDAPATPAPPPPALAPVVTGSAPIAVATSSAPVLPGEPAPRTPLGSGRAVDASSPRPAPAPGEPVAASKPASDPAVVAPVVAAASGSSGADAAPSPQVERASRLREESALVGQANAALHAGNAAEALRLLNEATTRFPGGVLGQERELLTIDALARSGQRAAASQRAAAFLAAHPASPHAARLRPYLP